MTKFKYREMRARRGEFVKSADVEQTLDLLNDTLERIDIQVSQSEMIFPPLFIIGLHRSGATLLTQVLINFREVGYVNNLTARFWKNPVVGLFLSRETLDYSSPVSFHSKFGKTLLAHEPHEFSYFWHHHFLMEEMPPYEPEVAALSIDWNRFKSTIQAMASFEAKPFIFKASDVAYHLAKVSEILPEALFIKINRPLDQVAYSLYKTRMRYFGNDTNWVGSYPPNFIPDETVSGIASVCEQTVKLEKLNRLALSQIASKRVFEMSLQDLCLSTPDILVSIDQFFEKNGYRSPRIKRLPLTQKLEYRVHDSGECFGEIKATISELENKIL